MTCERGSASCSFAPSSMQCYNRGFDGRDVQVVFLEFIHGQWECKAELDKGVSLGETVVSCEGYDYPGTGLFPSIITLDDPYILVGSCGVRFKLERNADYGTYHNHHHRHGYNGYNGYNDYNDYNGGGFWSWFDNIANFVFTVSSMNSFYYRSSSFCLLFG